MTDSNNKFMLTGVAYDRAKWLVQLFLPALGTFYYSLAEILDLKGGEQVLAVCGLLAVFLGTILRISTNNYYNSDQPYAGNIVVTEDDKGKKIFSLEVNKAPVEIEGSTVAMFKVTDTPSEGEYE